MLMVLAACSPPPQPPNAKLWGGLDEGPYKVGFGLRWETDPSRTYGTNPDGTKRPRPIPVGVWYPARPSPGEFMQVADYFDLRSKQTQFDELALKLNAQMQGAVRKEELDWRTHAKFDAPPAKGPFPVIIYSHGGRGYAENFVPAEYLASHGYIVLSTSYHCEDLATVAPCDGTARIRDMLFLHRFAAMLGNADASRIGALGFGAGADAVAAWGAEKDSPLEVVVRWQKPLDRLAYEQECRETLRSFDAKLRVVK